ncbi:diguanylate cyclase [Cognatishimia sp. WU-CL00825]|uniref:diguanylate cyclase domain-containing protein n=1 Tax=Cognatishimia sp. WU-CL00825 TaxID=3127658 RepID=UPI003104FCF6
MPGKLLIIDSIATNRIVLKVRLSTAFYEVSQAATAKEARNSIAKVVPDIILLNEQMQDLDVLRFCKELRKNPDTAHIPIVLLTSACDRKKKLAALKAGVNDVLVRPLDDLVLLARLRSLLRATENVAESDLRTHTSEMLGLAEDQAQFQKPALITITGADLAIGVRWRTLLGPLLPFRVKSLPLHEALSDIANQNVPDVFVIAIDRDQPELSLRLVAEIRARAATRNSGILGVLSKNDRGVLVDALDLGAHEVVTDGFDPEEIALRISGLVQRKRFSDQLRAHVNDGWQAALTDPLTGLFNRRYALPHLTRLAKQASQAGQPFAVMIADLDHFKQVNDCYGHAAGDAVLAETARRMRDHLRAVDMVARIGGEEFLIALPDVSVAQADRSATRLCAAMRETPIAIKTQNLVVPITMSIGITMGGDGAPIDLLLQEADKALYGAKSHGRDQTYFHPEHA